MRLEQLHYFVEVAKNKSISLTAEKIHVSQPTISESLKSLEKELGIILYNRNYQGIYLTKQGEQIAKIAQKILFDVKKIQNLDHPKNEIQSRISGNLRVYAVSSISNSILPKIVPIFVGKFPKIKLTVMERESTEIISNISESRGDLGLLSIMNSTTRGHLIQSPNAKNLMIEHLFNEKILALVCKNSPVSRKKNISMKDLIKYPLVIDNYLMEGLDDNFLSTYGEPNIVLNSSNIQLCIETISSGQLVGFYP